MDAAQRLTLDESLQRFNTKRELADGEPALGAAAALPQTVEMLRSV